MRSLDPTWVGRINSDCLFSLRGKTAIVTGAAGGVGRWLSAGLGLAGAHLLLTGRDRLGLEELSDDLDRLGVASEILVLDLKDARAPETVVRTALDRHGRLDILVNNAGINERIPMLDVEPESLRTIWQVDFIRCYELAQTAARAMVTTGGGSIIHIGSVQNTVGLEDVSMLGPTKAALSQLAKVMTVELGHLGVRTNVLAPGFLDTPMNATHWGHPTRGPWIMDHTPMSRPGHPAELVGATLLLASAAGSFLSGQTIYVDGGFTAGSRWNVPGGDGYARFIEWVESGRPVPAFGDGDCVPEEGG